MNKTFQEIFNIPIDFSHKRGWSNSDPNQLISSILIELGELAEHYQWQSRFTEWGPEKKQEVGFEFVDVLFYLFKLAHNSGIDLEECFLNKLPKLESKYPMGLTEEEYNEAHREYRASGKSKLYE